MRSALTAAFDGSSAGELRSFVWTIADRRVVDFYRRAGRANQADSLSHGGGTDDDDWATQIEDHGAGGAVEVRMVVDTALSELRADHRAVVEFSVFQDVPAAEVCRQVHGMTEANVYQVVRRFRTGLRARLEAGER